MTREKTERTIPATKPRIDNKNNEVLKIEQTSSLSFFASAFEILFEIAIVKLEEVRVSKKA